jgi:hypothetical protein
MFDYYLRRDMYGMMENPPAVNREKRQELCAANRRGLTDRQRLLRHGRNRICRNFAGKVIPDKTGRYFNGVISRDIMHIAFIRFFKDVKHMVVAFMRPSMRVECSRGRMNGFQRAAVKLADYAIFMAFLIVRIIFAVGGNGTLASAAFLPAFARTQIAKPQAARFPSCETPALWMFLL